LSVTSSNSWGKIARYVGKYISKHIGQRLPEDKGARLVRYSKGTNRVGTRFSWMSPGAMMWRAKLGTFCRMLNLNSDNYVQFLAEWFGRNWVYHLRPLIDSIKLPELYSSKESVESLMATWTVAQYEKQRKYHSRHLQDARIGSCFDAIKLLNAEKLTDRNEFKYNVLY
jgi:hypothetical protein